MSSEITVWDPYVFENPQDYIPKSEEEADEIRWTTLSYVSKVQYPPNPKFKIFAQTLQDLSQQDYFNDTFNERYAYAVQQAEDSANTSKNRFITLDPMSYHSSSNEHLLPMYELAKRYQLVVFDQNRGVVLLPDGSTIPSMVRKHLIGIAQEVRQRESERPEDWEGQGVLTQRFGQLWEVFLRQATHYFAQFGYQPTADNKPYVRGRHCRFEYQKEEFGIIKSVGIGLEGSEGEYVASMGFGLMVPEVGDYFQLALPNFSKGASIRLLSGTLHYQKLNHPTELAPCLSKGEPLLRLMESVHSYEQAFELWLTPVPLDLEDPYNHHARGKYGYIYGGGQWDIYTPLEAMILAWLINKPAIYTAVIEHLYEDTINSQELHEAKISDFKRFWAVISSALERDYPVSFK